MENDVIKYVKFSEIDLSNSFFDSLKEDYPGFEDWFVRKSGESAYILNEGTMRGFLYLKDEDEASDDITPPFEKKRRLKIGTFKIDSHGTVLGERFMSIIMNEMIAGNYDEIYVTLFDKQVGLIRLFEKFGFENWGEKSNHELVYSKSLKVSDDIFKNYPRLQVSNANYYLLGIWPKFHTLLFPQSRLMTERDHFIQDLSFTNTIEKVYLTKMYGIENLKKDDLLIIYRTAEQGKSARFSSVATSVCTVIDYKNISEFSSFEEYSKFIGKGTIFQDRELRSFWNSKNYPHVIKMLYNVALQKRIVRDTLLEEVGIDTGYAGFMKLSEEQFNNILELGEVHESFIID